MKPAKLLKWRLLSICFSLFFLFLICEIIFPAYTNWIAQCEIIKTKKEQIQLSENWQQELLKLKNEKNRLETKFERISQGYNVLQNFSDAIELLNTAAKRNDITILDIHISDKNKIENFEQIDIITDIEGSFHNIGKFLKQLEKLENPLQLNSLTIDETDTVLLCSISLTITIMKNQL